ncbi:hypothetical protein ACJX0J_026497, partial [Zea mays]
ERSSFQNSESFEFLSLEHKFEEELPLPYRYKIRITRMAAHNTSKDSLLTVCFNNYTNLFNSIIEIISIILGRHESEKTASEDVEEWGLEDKTNSNEYRKSGRHEASEDVEEWGLEDKTNSNEYRKRTADASVSIHDYLYMLYVLIITLIYLIQLSK